MAFPAEAPDERVLTPKRVESVVDRSYQTRKIQSSLRVHQATLTALGTDVQGLRTIVEGLVPTADEGGVVGPTTQGLTEDQFASLGMLYTQVQNLQAAHDALRAEFNSYVNDIQGPFNAFVSAALADHAARLAAGGL